MRIPEELLTIRDFIRWGASRFIAADLFFGHGTDNALDEASQLVFHALNLPHDLPPLYLDGRLSAEERTQVGELLWRRIEERRPGAYLTQRAWFAGLEFFVNEHVLIPRSPIAELIETRFEPWIDFHGVNSILDLCTGSGCIGIAAAVYLNDVQVDLADISDDALSVAAKNRERYALGDRVRLVRSDLFEGLEGRRYDVILSNPPYVSSAEYSTLPAEYAWEPRIGLEGGASGLEFVRRILRDAGGHLNPEGILVVEVGEGAEALEMELPEVPFVWLEFERGGEGVFLLTAGQLRENEGLFSSWKG